MNRSLVALLTHGLLSIAAARAQEAVPLVLGERRVLHSKALGEERMLHIRLPMDYSPDSAARYPVIYALDGGLDEDFIHLAGLVEFASMPWIDWLPPCIVVGIVNTDRKRDFTHPTTIAKDKEQFPTTGGSASFIRFLGDELIPFIDSTYRTSSERTLIGQSLGGLLAAEVLMERPELFARYMVVSPSLWWDNGSVLAREAAFTKRPDAAPKQVWIAVGKEGKVMVNGAMRLARLLRRNPAIQVRVNVMPRHDHGNILHQAVLDAVRWMKEGD
jgi:uncharacterized protein